MLRVLQYITWINAYVLTDRLCYMVSDLTISGAAAWTIKSAGMAADPKVEIGARPIPQEPMYRACLSSTAWKYAEDPTVIVNLGISPNFGYIDFDHLTFPVRRTAWPASGYALLTDRLSSDDHVDRLHP